MGRDEQLKFFLVCFVSVSLFLLSLSFDLYDSRIPILFRWMNKKNPFFRLFRNASAVICRLLDGGYHVVQFSRFDRYNVSYPFVRAIEIQLWNVKNDPKKKPGLHTNTTRIGGECACKTATREEKIGWQQQKQQRKAKKPYARLHKGIKMN